MARYTKEQEQQAYKEYLATLEVLTSENSLYTGDWKKDKSRYMKEWSDIQDILGDEDWNVITKNEDYYEDDYI